MKKLLVGMLVLGSSLQIQSEVSQHLFKSEMSKEEIHHAAVVYAQEFANRLTDTQRQRIHVILSKTQHVIEMAQAGIKDTPAGDQFRDIIKTLVVELEPLFDVVKTVLSLEESVDKVGTYLENNLEDSKAIIEEVLGFFEVK